MVGSASPHPAPHHCWPERSRGSRTQPHAGNFQWELHAGAVGRWGKKKAGPRLQGISSLFRETRFIQIVVHVFSLDRASCFHTSPHLAFPCFSEAVFSSLCSQESTAFRGDVLVQVPVVVLVKLSLTPSPSGPNPRSLWPTRNWRDFLSLGSLESKTRDQDLGDGGGFKEGVGWVREWYEGAAAEKPSWGWVGSIFPGPLEPLACRMEG